MKPLSITPAAIAQPTSGELALSGCWTALGIGALDRQLETLSVPPKTEIVVDGAGVERLDTVGVRILQKLLQRLRGEGHAVELRGWSPQLMKFLELVSLHNDAIPPPPIRFLTVERIGRAAVEVGEQALAMLGFIGESAVAFAGSIAHPARIRWRPILHNIGSAGFDALPIVGLLSFLMGIVIAYQAADQLRQYGANIFVVDLVGLSMLREFAPLMTAIIVAGRSGSAFAAQIGTMSVSEEIDAMRTIGIVPIELLVLPKILALIIALPLLTFFADVMGVFGGMFMAHAQLGIGYEEFFDRFVKAVSLKAYMIGIGKAPVFAAIIAVVGCFQGFRTSGNADSVGRQTTRSVVDSIFLVIVTDALFSIFFSIMDI
ncbi:MAG: MlaE family lipid ABC transporter permease subunit [Gallionella sp.]